jgi:hypothetical protein
MVADVCVGTGDGGVSGYFGWTSACGKELVGRRNTKKEMRCAWHDDWYSGG